jgi:FlaA1/EpsC-like NDP-sugar epimerase
MKYHALLAGFIGRLTPPYRRVLRAMGLMPVFVAVYLLSHWIRFEGHFPNDDARRFAATIGMVVAIKLVAFAWLHPLGGHGRLVTFHDLLSLAKAATVSSVVLALPRRSSFPFLSIPLGVLLIDWAFTILTIGGLRSITRLIQERLLPGSISRSGTPVLIVGTNDSGEALLRAIRRNPKLAYRVSGFVTDHRDMVGSVIDGVPVLGTLEETIGVAERAGVPEVLITAGDLPGDRVRALVKEARGRNVAVKVLPSYEQLLRGTVNLQPRMVSIEDLLRREPVRLDLTQLHQWIDDRVLLVTGSAGSIGSEICRQLLQFSPRKLVLVDRSENGQFFLDRELRAFAPWANIETCIGDVNDAPRMNALFSRFRPEIVFHAAAYKHVPLMEAQPEEAVKNIVLATRLLADLAQRHEVGSFVLISTDKAVNPTSVMGACKRVAELYVQALAAEAPRRFVTVRFGNVLDSAGSVVPIFREQIAHGGPVTVTHPEMRRFFMTIPEAAQLVVQAGAMGQGGEIFVLDMGEPVKIVDLAAEMVRLSGLELGKDIEIEFIGMRPGEKEYEELRVEGERRVLTAHPKIDVATSDAMDLALVRAVIDRLAHQTDQSNEAIFETLRQVVPQYRRPPHGPKLRRAA